MVDYDIDDLFAESPFNRGRKLFTGAYSFEDINLDDALPHSTRANDFEGILQSPTHAGFRGQQAPTSMVTHRSEPIEDITDMLATAGKDDYQFNLADLERDVQIASQTPAAAQSSSGWVQMYSHAKRRLFYHNPHTKKSQWVLPPGQKLVLGQETPEAQTAQTTQHRLNSTRLHIDTSSHTSSSTGDFSNTLSNGIFSISPPSFLTGMSSSVHTEEKRPSTADQVNRALIETSPQSLSTNDDKIYNWGASRDSLDQIQNSLVFEEDCSSIRFGLSADRHSYFNRVQLTGESPPDRRKRMDRTTSMEEDAQRQHGYEKRAGVTVAPSDYTNYSERKLGRLNSETVSSTGSYAVSGCFSSSSRHCYNRMPGENPCAGSTGLGAKSRPSFNSSFVAAVEPIAMPEAVTSKETDSHTVATKITSFNSELARHCSSAKTALLAAAGAKSRPSFNSSVVAAVEPVAMPAMIISKETNSHTVATNMTSLNSALAPHSLSAKIAPLAVADTTAGDNEAPTKDISAIMQSPAMPIMYVPIFNFSVPKPPWMDGQQNNQQLQHGYKCGRCGALKAGHRCPFKTNGGADLTPEQVQNDKRRERDQQAKAARRTVYGRSIGFQCDLDITRGPSGEVGQGGASTGGGQSN
jgi:hypothetical protein